MAVYRRQALHGLGHSVKPTIATLNGLRAMRRNPVEAVMRAQDYVVAMSRRIVASGGIRGSETWRTPDTDPTAGPTHPAPTDRRVIGQGACDLTPGCFLRLWAVAVPSGETIVPGAPTSSGANGRVEVDVDWIDSTGTTVSTTHTASLPGSQETYGAEPSTMWNNLHHKQIIDVRPPGLESTSTLRRWCQHTHVRATIYAVGGARIVDAVLFEMPWEVAYEVDDDSDRWCSHMYGQGSPAGATAPLTYPFQRFDETTPDGDPRGGTWHMMDVHHAQHTRLGPIFTWCAARESDGTESVTTASASLVALDGGGSTAFDLTEPGLACGCFGYARRQSDNSPFVLRDRVAAVPVIVRVYASSTGTGTVRVQTRVDSYIDVTITGGSLAWHSVQGWLEVGLCPDDTARTLVQLWYETATVQSVSVYYAGGYVPNDA